jgi:dUTPase
MNNIKIKFIDAKTEALYKSKNAEASDAVSITQKDVHAGFQLIATSVRVDLTLHTITYGTGICFQIPDNTFGDIRVRSSIREKMLDLSNSAGVLEHTYTGEIAMTFRYDAQRILTDAGYYDGEDANEEDVVLGSKFVYEVGNTIGQLIVLERFAPTGTKYNIVQELDATVRGNNGFGSTGK